MRWGYDLSKHKTNTSDVLPPERLYHLPKQHHQLVMGSSNYWAYEEHLLFKPPIQSWFLFLILWYNILRKALQCRRGLFWLTSQGYTPLSHKVKATGALHCVHSQEWEASAYWCSLWFLHFTQSNILAQGMSCTRWRQAFPQQLNQSGYSLTGMLRGYTIPKDRYVASLLIDGRSWLTINIRHHTKNKRRMITWLWWDETKAFILTHSWS